MRLIDRDDIPPDLDEDPIRRIRKLLEIIDIVAAQIDQKLGTRLNGNKGKEG